jgi:hypothetical protein
MALRFIDGFDNYTTLTQKWTATANGPSINTTAGRRGSGGALTNAGAIQLLKTLDSQGTWIVGFACNTSSLTFNYIELMDAGTTQLRVSFGSTGVVSLYRGAGTTLLGSSAAGVVSASTWFYLEIKATFAGGTSGSATVRVNGAAVITLTGINTITSANASADTLNLRTTGGGATVVYDDLYMCDGTGSTNNDFLGDLKVQYLAPASDGAHTDWTPNSGANHYSRVADTNPDDDTSYNSTATAGNIDTFKVGAATAGTILGVQYTLRHRVDDAGTHTVAPLVRVASTDYPGSGITCSASYVTSLVLQETNPATSAAWASSDFGASGAEFGYKMVS